MGWEELFVVHEEECVCWYSVNLGSCWVAPLEVCAGIAMVTGYGRVFWGPVVSRVVVEMPPALGVPVVMEFKFGFKCDPSVLRWTLIPNLNFLVRSVLCRTLIPNLNFLVSYLFSRCIGCVGGLVKYIAEVTKCLEC